MKTDEDHPDDIPDLVTSESESDDIQRGDPSAEIEPKRDTPNAASNMATGMTTQTHEEDMRMPDRGRHAATSTCLGEERTDAKEGERESTQPEPAIIGNGRAPRNDLDAARQYVAVNLFPP